MDQALIEDAQHDVDDQYRDHEQNRQPAERVLEGFDGAVEVGGDGGGQAHFAQHVLHLVGAIAERHARREIERDGHRRKLAPVIDGQWADGAIQFRHGVERNQLAARRADVKLRQRIRRALILRLDFHDHAVFVGRACR